MSINTYSETSLHEALKIWVAQPGDKLEIKVDGYYIDILRGDCCIEIQTRNFSAIRKKLATLLEQYTVRLVHPIAQTKWIVQLDENGDRIKRRKSPQKGRLEFIFKELVYLPELINHPNFSLDVLLIDAEEIQQDDGQGSWRRKGRSIVDRRLLAVNEQASFASGADLAALLPDSCEQPFTNRDLATALKLPMRPAQQMTYCLSKMGQLELIGKSGRAHLYARR